MFSNYGAPVITKSKGEDLEQVHTYLPGLHFKGLYQLLLLSIKQVLDML